MSDAAYDHFADAYHRWWGPVLAPSARMVIEPIADELDRRPRAQVVDVGAGTGGVAIEILKRWPRVSATGIDPSAEMLKIARREAERAGTEISGRLRLIRGDALRLPIAGASADVAVSTFVVQLVASRAAMLREVRGILRPGGIFACLTWLADEYSFEPDLVFDDALDELRIDPPPRGPAPRPYTSPRAAAAELRRAGFRSVHAEEVWLDHRWDAESYAGLLEHWAEEELFLSLAEPLRDRLRRRTSELLSRLPAEEFVWQRPLTLAVGRTDGRR